LDRGGGEGIPLAPKGGEG